MLSQDEHEEQQLQEPQLPHVLWQLGAAQLSQQSCLRKRPRSRSHHDGLSQQLSQDVQQVVGQVGLQQGAGGQQVVGQPL
ncbi:MAG: hypothetical protein HYS12_22685 [Planctomycetes bacterium]|nr:hypothetical protein [Planctomycetota bacterium]